MSMGREAGQPADEATIMHSRHAIVDKFGGAIRMETEGARASQLEVQRTPIWRQVEHFEGRWSTTNKRRCVNVVLCVSREEVR